MPLDEVLWARFILHAQQVQNMLVSLLEAHKDDHSLSPFAIPQRPCSAKCVPGSGTLCLDNARPRPIYYLSRGNHWCLSSVDVLSLSNTWFNCAQLPCFLNRPTILTWTWWHTSTLSGVASMSLQTFLFWCVKTMPWSINCLFRMPPTGGHGIAHVAQSIVLRNIVVVCICSPSF